ncbi:hypothetical protein BX070DRAFT_229348 [Coemansia spiralis]|nr:hypothetical protein BX070DRAFT_229348 [Coemansia spiralis]
MPLPDGFGCLPLQHPKTCNLCDKDINSKFWLLANALRRYVESDYAQGKLPLSGKIPDMKADTSGYIALQRIYKEKAEQDKNELIKHVADVLTASRLPADFISQEEIDIFAKNANLLRLVRTSSVHNEYANGPSDLDMLSMNELLSHYALFRASDAFFSKHVRYPGAPAPSTEQAARSSLTTEDLNKLVESDTSELVGMANELLAKWQPNNHENGGQKNTVSDELAAEFARSGHCELHNVASVCGGVIAQEAIKLITHQYVPGNNIFVFDGVQGRLLSAKV